MKVYVAQDRNELNDSTILFTSKAKAERYARR